MMVATLFAACTQDDTKDLAPKTPMPEKVYASISTPEEFSRVHLNENLKTVWDANDIILVVINSAAAYYQFTGTAGSSCGEFVKIEDVGTVSSVYDKPFAMYSDYLGLAKFTNGSPAPIMSIPTEQTYMHGSYDSQYGAPMLGQSETGNLNFEFKQLSGFLRLQLTGSKVVKSIKISTNNDVLSGVFYTILPPTPGAESYVWYKDQANYITLNCGYGAQLSNTPTDFYFVMLPGQYAAGIDMVVTFTDNSSFAKKSTNTLTIEPNTIQPIRVINTDGDSDPIPSTEQHLSVTYNTPEAYLPIFTGVDNVTGTVNFDDGFTGVINSYVYYQFADTKATHNVSYTSEGATIVEFVNCYGLTHIDFSNF